jgi:hypothetical protein
MELNKLVKIDKDPEEIVSIIKSMYSMMKEFVTTRPNIPLK